jgi:hypothetical protein
MSIRFPYSVRLTTALERFPTSFVDPSEGLVVYGLSALRLEHISDMSCVWLHLAYEMGLYLS